LISHETRAHTGKYAFAGEYFAKYGFDVIGFDLPNHGKSAGSP